MCVVHVGFRHIKLVNWFKYFRTPTAIMAALLEEGGGASMIIVGAGRPGRKSQGIFLPRTSLRQVYLPLRSWGEGGGGVSLFPSPCNAPASAAPYRPAGFIG